MRQAEKIIQCKGNKEGMVEILLAEFSEQIHYPLSKFTREEKETLRGLFRRSGGVKEQSRLASKRRRKSK